MESLSLDHHQLKTMCVTPTDALSTLTLVQFPTERYLNVQTCNIADIRTSSIPQCHHHGRNKLQDQNPGAVGFKRLLLHVWFQIWHILAPKLLRRTSDGTNY